jgi:hypothetical protein
VSRQLAWALLDRGFTCLSDAVGYAHLTQDAAAPTAAAVEPEARDEDPATLADLAER